MDLAKTGLSGLDHSLDALKNIEDLALVELDSEDAFRHGLVEKIAEAYGRYKKEVALTFLNMDIIGDPSEALCTQEDAISWFSSLKGEYEKSISKLGHCSFNLAF
jgi:Phosphate starvation-inducible protein PhoH, predicted ATPase